MKFVKNMRIQLFVFIVTIYFSNAFSRQVEILSDFDIFSNNSSNTINLKLNWEFKEADNKNWRQLPASNYIGEENLYELRAVFKLDSSFIGNKYRLIVAGFAGPFSIYLNKQLLGRFFGNNFPINIDIKEQNFSIGSNEIFFEWDTRLNFHNTLPLKFRPSGIPPVCGHFGAAINLKSISYPLVTETHFIKEDKLLFSAKIEHAINSETKKRRTGHAVFRINNKINGQQIWRSPQVTADSSNQNKSQFSAAIPLHRFASWEKGNPALYELEISLIEQFTQTKISKFQFSILNKEVDFSQVKKIKCIEWVQDKSFCSLTTGEKNKVIEADIKAIRQLKANAVRFPGFAPPEYYIEKCDSLGIGVFIEIPIFSIPPKIFENELFSAKATSLLSETVKALKKHPSIYAWGIGSGFVDQSPAHEFLRSLIKVINDLDDRPVYAGIQGKNKWKSELPTDIKLIDLHPDNFDSFLNNSSAIDIMPHHLVRLTVPITNNNNQFQAALLRNLTIRVLDSPTAGCIITPLRDWFGDSPHLFWGPRKGANIFTAGLRDVTNKTRPAFSTIQSTFAASNPKIKKSINYKPTEVFVFQILQAFILFIFLMFMKTDRVFMQYLRRIFFFPHGFYIDLSENRRVSPLLTSIVGGTVILTLSIIIASLQHFLRSSFFFDDILTYFFANPNIKYKVLWITWHPLLLTIFWALVLFAFAILQSFVFKIITVIQGRYLKLPQLITFVMWVPANLLLTTPVAIVLYRSMERSAFVGPQLYFIGAMLVWSFIRTLRGTKALLQFTIIQTLLLYAITAIVIGGMFGFYFEYNRSLLAYIDLFISLIGI